MRKQVLALGFHGISREWPEPLAVTPNALERGVRYLLARGWTATTFTEALLSPSGQRLLAVTFDDACRSVFEHAYPILERLGVPATVFVSTAYADDSDIMAFGTLKRWLGTHWEEEVRSLRWDDLRRLQAAGWEIGSHTETHAHLSRLDDQALARELEWSKKRCEEELGTDCRAVAYPFSDLSPRVIDAARQAGYVTGATVEVGLRRYGGSLLEWPRVGIYRPDGWARFRLKTSPTVRGVRRRVAALRGA